MELGIGLGKMGYPLALNSIEKGIEVIGFRIETIDKLKQTRKRTALRLSQRGLR